MTIQQRKAFGWLLALFMSAPVSAVQTIAWDRAAIPVQLIVGVEQMVSFEGPATMGLPPGLLSQQVFRHLFVNDTAYWTALQPFKKQRIKVRLDNTGQYLLIDVSAKTRRSPPKSSEPLRIVTKTDTALASDSAAVDASPAQHRREKATMFDVLRYAVQNDYAPARVIDPVTGITRSDLKTSPELRRYYRHSDNTFLSFRPVRSYRAAGWYVTAIQVTNRSGFELTLDPARLQYTPVKRVNGVKNDFIAAAMVVRELKPRGQAQDRTWLYVVTDNPFMSVIGR